MASQASPVVRGGGLSVWDLLFEDIEEVTKDWRVVLTVVAPGVRRPVARVRAEPGCRQLWWDSHKPAIRGAATPWRNHRLFVPVMDDAVFPEGLLPALGESLRPIFATRDQVIRAVRCGARKLKLTDYELRPATERRADLTMAERVMLTLYPEDEPQGDAVGSKTV